MHGRPLSKSRYRLGLECPAKVFYSLDKTYLNRKEGDDFLRALADGGFQVGELARRMNDPGQLVETLDSVEALKRTKELLEQGPVTIFEGAFGTDDCLIRADIVRRRGRIIDLVEVKSKGIDPDADHIFTGKRGNLTSGWVPYLQDVAFQTYVMRVAMPEFEVRPRLMLADKSAVAPIDGLNGYFLLRKDERNRTSVHMTRALPPAAIEQPMLAEIDVSDLVEQILADDYEGMSFGQLVAQWAAASKEGRKILSPISGTKCASCEFRAGPEERSEGKRSGFHECWAAQTGLSEEDLDGPLVTGVWNSRQKNDWTRAGIYRLQDLPPSAIRSTGKQPASGWSQSERQTIQVQSVRQNRTKPVVDMGGLRAALSSLRYPLHFIDFETTRSALPFHRGMRPYGQVAFQFSHHLATEDGFVSHAGDWLCLERGKLPNREFVKALRAELGNDSGSILHYANHERSVLEDLSEDADPEDAAWIRSLVTVQGGRMADMQKLLLRHYYHPLARGSNSLKAILPAILRTSPRLQTKYSQPVYGTDAMPSRNFREKAWVQTLNGVPSDPYASLEPLEGQLSGERLFSDDQIKDGGGAMTAYAKCQFTEMSSKEIDMLRVALLRYCELDTLAMVMLWEEWSATVGHRS